MYDAIIIGAGPAGLAAAVYFARQKLHFLILSGDVGGQALWSSDIDDYLGFHMLNGIELVEKFKSHLEDYKGSYDLHEGERAQSVARAAGGFRVTTDRGSYDARALLLATGTKHRELGVPGEKELYGHGVTYCATCDAPLFKGKKVVVVGGGNSAMDAALFLEKYTDDVTLISLNASLMGDEIMKSKILAAKDIHVLYETKTTKINGDKMVTSVSVVDAQGIEADIPCEGIFVEVGLTPVTQFIDFVEKDGRGQIVVDKRNMTSVPGIFAAGDCTDVMQKQVSVAVGEGSKAALSLIYHLQSNQ